jgi:hypothetical protein
MTDDGYTMIRRRDGGLQIDIDMVGTPWPYDPLGWAAMLPGVQNCIAAALLGRDQPLVLRMQRSRPRLTTDVVLEIRGGEIRVHDLRARVEHRVQIDCGTAGQQRRLLRVAAALVHVLLCAGGMPVQLSSRCEKGSVRLVS